MVGLETRHDLDDCPECGVTTTGYHEIYTSQGQFNKLFVNPCGCRLYKEQWDNWTKGDAHRVKLYISRKVNSLKGIAKRIKGYFRDKRKDLNNLKKHLKFS